MFKTYEEARQYQGYLENAGAEFPSEVETMDKEYLILLMNDLEEAYDQNEDLEIFSYVSGWLDSRTH